MRARLYCAGACVRIGESPQRTPQASKALRELFMSKKKAAANAWPLSEHSGTAM